jgi:hypothetical protein
MTGMFRRPLKQTIGRENRRRITPGADQIVHRSHHTTHRAIFLLAFVKKICPTQPSKAPLLFVFAFCA